MCTDQICLEVTGMIARLARSDELANVQIQPFHNLSLFQPNILKHVCVTVHTIKEQTHRG